MPSDCALLAVRRLASQQHSTTAALASQWCPLMMLLKMIRYGQGRERGPAATSGSFPDELSRAEPSQAEFCSSGLLSPRTVVDSATTSPPNDVFMASTSRSFSMGYKTRQSQPVTLLQLSLSDRHDTWRAFYSPSSIIHIIVTLYRFIHASPRVSRAK